MIAASLLLAGCFTSTEPKFPLSSAAPVLGDGGHYVSYERMKDGNFQRDEAFDVRRRADGAYDLIDAKGSTTTASLHSIGSDLYVAQAVSTDSRRADYARLRVRGNEVLSYALDCRKQDAAILKALAVEIKGVECVIDKVADPAHLFATLELGDPIAKMVRE